MGKRHLLTRACALVALGLWPSSLWAQPPAEPVKRTTVRLSWVRGTGAGNCPDQRAIEKRVERRLGYRPFDRDASRSIEASVARGEEGYRLHVHYRREDGEAVGSRDLSSDAEECDGLTDAAVLSIALLIDPDAPPPAPVVAPSDDPEPAPPSATNGPPSTGSTNAPEVSSVPPPSPWSIPSPAPSVAPSVAPPWPTAPPEPPSSFRTGGRAAAYIIVGPLPRAAAGFGAQVELAFATRLRVGLGARVVPAVATGDGALEIGLYDGLASFCAAPLKSEDGQLDLCATAHVGAMTLGVRELLPLNVGPRLWVSAALAVEGRLHLVGPLFAGLGAALEVPFLRDDLRIVGREGTSHRAAAVGGTGSLLVGVAMP